ncbi:MAG: response regulator [Thermoanaerobaculia bacterium]
MVQSGDSRGPRRPRFSLPKSPTFLLPKRPTVTKPWKAASESAVPEENRGAAQPGTTEPRKRLLAVDDDAAIRNLVAKIAERAGFACDVATDGGDAIEKISTVNGRGYALILLDLMMPNISGFDVIQHLRLHQPELLSRVVVLSAVSRITDERICRDRIRDVIHKPFDIHELGAYLKRAVEA